MENNHHLYHRKGMTRRVQNKELIGMMEFMKENVYSEGKGKVTSI